MPSQRVSKRTPLGPGQSSPQGLSRGARALRAAGVVIVPVVLLLSRTLLAQIVTPEVRKVSEKFVCQCGCREQLSVCAMLNCGSATPLRTEIGELLKQGKTEKEIVDAFVTRYGKVILAAPTTQGFDLAAWTLPFVMLLLGMILIYFLIKAWAKRKLDPVMEGVGAAVIPEDYQKRIDRELKELD